MRRFELVHQSTLVGTTLDILQDRLDKLYNLSVSFGLSLLAQ